jgi:hypothetical protein
VILSARAAPGDRHGIRALGQAGLETGTPERGVAGDREGAVPSAGLGVPVQAFRRDDPTVRARSPISLSFCRANRQNISPRCCRSVPKSTFRLYFGMKTTWYLLDSSEFSGLSAAISPCAPLVVPPSGG